MENPQNQDQLEISELQKLQLSESITLALELDRLFKVFSFRIITPEQYIESVQAASMDYLETIKS